MSTKRNTMLGIAAAFSGAVALAAGGVTGAAAAEGEQVKCYGVAKAGENDCASKGASHSCAGHSTQAFWGGDWKTMAKDACMQMGGKTEPWEGFNEMAKKG